MNVGFGFEGEVVGDFHRASLVNSFAIIVFAEPGSCLEWISFIFRVLTSCF
jgi:hypothetical protein